MTFILEALTYAFITVFPFWFVWKTFDISCTLLQNWWSKRQERKKQPPADESPEFEIVDPSKPYGEDDDLRSWRKSRIE